MDDDRVLVVLGVREVAARGRIPDRGSVIGRQDADVAFPVPRQEPGQVWLRRIDNTLPREEVGKVYRPYLLRFEAEPLSGAVRPVQTGEELLVDFRCEEAAVLLVQARIPDNGFKPRVEPRAPVYAHLVRVGRQHGSGRVDVTRGMDPEPSSRDSD